MVAVTLASSSSQASSTDTKLLFHIRKLLSTNSRVTNNSTFSIDFLCESLTKNYREYKRRYNQNQSKFKQSVKTSLDIALSEKSSSSAPEGLRRSNSSTSINSTGSTASTNKKRKWYNSEKDEKETSEESDPDEIEAQQLDSIRKEFSEKNQMSSSLNASLRKNYKSSNTSAATSEVEDNNEDNDDKLPSIREEEDCNDNNKKKTSPISKNSSAKKKKKKRSSVSGSSQNNDSIPGTEPLNAQSTIPTERYSDLGGMNSTIKQIRELIEYPLRYPELFSHLGVDPPRGILLKGPPGVGKTHLANAVAGEIGVSFYRISAPELIGGVSGESEQRVRDLFDTATKNSPSLIFIDEIDAIAPKRGDGSKGGGGSSMEKRIVAQFLTSMDSVGSSRVIVLGATNRPDAIDPALRRAGRFDREILVGVPDEKGREAILKKISQKMRLSGDFNFREIAKKTPGFVGADLKSVTKEAAVVAINRIFKSGFLGNNDDSAKKSEDNNSNTEKREGDDKMEVDKDESTTLAAQTSISSVPLTPEQLSPLYITMDDFLSAIPQVQPSSKREGFATVPDVTWDNIGALSSIREELNLSVIQPIQHPENFESLGIPLPAGVLLFGPPGCGKTLLAKAIANESGANFISVKGPELLDKYVGESEKAVRQVFDRARSSSPCIVFFDELDSLCPKRGSDKSGGGVSERVVNQLLTEMDGLNSRNSVFIIAATNRPELIDPAMLRPGRLDKLLYVPLPSPEDRVSILHALSKKINLSKQVNIDEIATSNRADGYSGADCAALIREAGLAVLRDITDFSVKRDLVIEPHHFEYAFKHVLPSVSKKDQVKYDKIRDRMARARTRGGLENEDNEKNIEDKKKEGEQKINNEAEKAAAR